MKRFFLAVARMASDAKDSAAMDVLLNILV